MDRWNLAIVRSGVLTVWQDLLITLFFAMGCAPLAFFSGQAGCFCCPATHCGGACLARPTEVTVTITGVVNNNCTNCSYFDATWILPAAFSDSSSCIRQVQICLTPSCATTPCTDLNPSLSCTHLVTATVFPSGGNVWITAELRINSCSPGPSPHDTTITWSGDTGVATPTDCVSIGATPLAHVSTVGGATPSCASDGSSITAQITA